MIVSGIMMLPRMDCRKGAVRAAGEAKTTRTPLSASATPTIRNCHCGKRRSSMLIFPNTAENNVAAPKITTKEKDAELSTKYGSIAPELLLTFPLSRSDSLVQFGFFSPDAVPTHSGREMFCPTCPITDTAAKKTFKITKRITLWRRKNTTEFP